MDEKTCKEKEQTMRIAIDMDEVIADTFAKELKVYNQLFKTDYRKEDLAGKELIDLVPEHEAVICGLLNEADFFADLDVMPDAQRVVKKLHATYEVFITSAAMEFPSSFSAKFSWTRENFPFIPAKNMVFCGDKSIIHADYMIDDNLRNFQNFCGKGLLFTAPHNCMLDYPNRVNNWLEIEKFFKV